VDNKFLKKLEDFAFENGFSIHIAATVSFWIDSIIGSWLIFCSAEIIAYLSFVNSTLPASAKYSLLRESANLISGYIKYHRSNKPSHININIPHDLLSSLEDLPEDLIKICPNVPTIHTKTTIIIIIKESLFKICVNSCHATASISDLFNLFKSHLEKTIRPFFTFHQVANAFKLLSSIIHIFGVASHLEIHKFSTIL
jgi:hypothetical protein